MPLLVTNLAVSVFTAHAETPCPDCGPLLAHAARTSSDAPRIASAVYTGYDPDLQTPEQWLNEAQTVYLGNMQRRANGAGPMRWSRELTQGARWFSFDSVENRPGGFCGHQDTLGTYPGSRVSFWGYRGGAGAENAFCGYLSPADAINGWMNSSGHRANLLDPQHREIGLGYYRRNSDGRGYVTQDFGADGVYPPVVINNEAINTTSPTVNLYISNGQGVGDIYWMGAGTKMMVSNRPDFAGATWEPYIQEKKWTLEPGQGWRGVYVRLADSLGRSVTVSDTIYLGDQLPATEINYAMMSNTQSFVRVPNLNAQNWPKVMLSLGWLADDQMGNYRVLWGNGERVNDSEARGGTASRLYSGNGTTDAWVWTTIFPRDVPLVAFARYKITDNTSPNVVARFNIVGGGTTYGTLEIKGTDFKAPNQYQEFALPFTFNRLCCMNRWNGTSPTRTE